MRLCLIGHFLKNYPSFHFLKFSIDFQSITVKGHDSACLHIRGFLEH